MSNECALRARTLGYRVPACASAVDVKESGVIGKDQQNTKIDHERDEFPDLA